MFLLFKKRNYKSQGIIESLVAITVVVVGLVSVLTLAVFNLRVQVCSHDMLIATNLAKEGIEVVRSIRDTNWMNGDDWDQGLITEYDNPVSEERGFLFRNGSVWEGEDDEYFIEDIGCSWEECVISDDLARLYLKSLDDKILYDQSGFMSPLEFVATKFYRVVFVNEICLDDSNQEYILTVYNQHCEDFTDEKIGFQIKSKVGWYDKDIMRTVEAEEWIYNWR